MTGPELPFELLFVVALSWALAAHATHSNRALNTPPIWLRLKCIISFLPDPLSADPRRPI